MVYAVQKVEILVNDSVPCQALAQALKLNLTRNPPCRYNTPLKRRDAPYVVRPSGLQSCHL
jgi:hypothetical protein